MKTYKIFFALVAGLLISINVNAQAPTIISPADGAIDQGLEPTITAQSTSTGNSGSSVERIYLEISVQADFDAGQGSPSYQQSGSWLKQTNGTTTHNWNNLETLDANTTYNVRAFSSKHGFGPVTTFTTETSKAPVITNPTEGQTGLEIQFTITATSESSNNSSSSPDLIRLELSLTPDFNNLQLSPNYQITDYWVKTTNGTSNHNWNFPDELDPNTTYYVRGISSKYGNGTAVSFTTGDLPAPELILVDGQDPSSMVYVNKEDYLLRCTTISGATSYNWEFDIEGDFLIPEYTTSSTGVNLAISTNDLISGQAYYVRVQSEGSATSDFANSTPVQYTNSLHPVTLWAPTGPYGQTSGKLWMPNVDNADQFVFQVDDNSDFSSPFENPAPLTGLNGTHTGVTGNVFYSNADWYDVTGWTPSANPITYRVLNYITGLSNNTTYYVRCRAANSNQEGYWSTTVGFTIGLGERVSGIANLADMQTDVPVNYGFLIYDDVNYTEHGYDFQVSEFSDFSSSFESRINTTSRYQFVNTMLYNTTYYARARSYVNNFNISNVSSYYSIQFTTQAAPTIEVTFPSNAQVLTSTGPYFYCEHEPAIEEYEWYLEDLVTPANNVTLTSTTYYRQFSSYLSPGGNYQISVRGKNNTQGITGSYSTPVPFSVSAGAKIGDDLTINNVQEELMIYPNPFNSGFHIIVPSELDGINVEIIDVNGRIVASYANLTSESISNRTFGNGIDDGLYVINVYTANDVLLQTRVVKQ